MKGRRFILKKRLLIVCDSHGAGYGTVGFSSMIVDRLGSEGWEVDVFTYGGIPVKAIHEKLRQTTLSRYDIAVIQVGNPDVHPRMPIKPLRFFRSRGLKFMRDSLFSVPPNLCLRYYLRFPFFLLRLLVLRFHKEFLVTLSELERDVTALIDFAASNAGELVIMPVFKVKASVYTPAHNERADVINNKLAAKYPHWFLTDSVLSPDVYEKYYNWDGFHFVKEYHELVCDLLVKVILRKSEAIYEEKENY
jgi:hypothetical protein